MGRPAVIVTLTPNPSLDLLFSAERLVWDDANRVAMPRRRAGGQGINVARAARALGGAAHAIAPLGGPVGRELQEMLEAEGTPLTAVPIGGETRVFVGVRESGTGRSLLLNPRGPEIAGPEADSLLAALERVLAAPVSTTPGDPAGPPDAGAPGPRWLAACGSLLPGLPHDFYARAGRLARSHGVRFVPDGDGDALARAVAGADLLVPNDLEAARLVGRPVDGPEAAVTAGRELLERGPGLVVITLGPRGAVAVTPDAAWWARPAAPPERAGALEAASAVGAGDAFLAALLLALEAGREPADAVVEAVAAGTATLLSTGTDLVRRRDVDEVRGWVEVSRLTANN